MTRPPDSVDKDAIVAALLARVETLTATNAWLVARIAELEAKLDQPPKTPGNSSVPPSKGQKASESSKPKPKGKPHAGSHRALHPNPTRRHPVFACCCRGCGADVSQIPQSPCETYDRSSATIKVRMARQTG
jgi:transposase